MTQRYAHLAPEAFREDYARLGSALPEGKLLVLPNRAVSAKGEGTLGAEDVALSSGVLR